MFSPKKKVRSDRLASPLDQKKEALKAKEDQLKQAAEQLKKLIDDAPRIREETTRRRREHLAADARLNRSALVDQRIYRVSTKETLGMRPLRSEKRDGKMLFLVLLVVIVFLAIWMASLLMTRL